MERLYVVGAGGIGCAVGYALCAAGRPPVFVDASPAKVAWGRAHGVAVDRLPPLPARLLHFDEWRPEPGATVLLCTKCYDNPAVLGRLPDPVCLVPIQNGFDPATVSRGCAGEGIASFISECLPGQTRTRVTRGGRLLNTLDERECFGEMAYIRGGSIPRHATVESVSELLLAEFDPATLAKMSVSAQLHLTRALVRNLVDRLEVANTRMAR